MVQLTTKPCSTNYDGTDDNIRLEFLNVHGENCKTDYLDTNKNDFWHGIEQDWVGDILMSCSGHRFRPIETLDFRFHSNTLNWNLHVDQLTLCEVTAQFGSPAIYNSQGELVTPETPGYSKWQWKGTTTNTHYTGYYNSHSNWNTMTKIEG